MAYRTILTLAAMAALGAAGAACSDQGEPAGQADAVASTGAETPDGVRFVEAVAADSAEIVIPFQKYVLDNGLTVILHEDHSDPLVHVDITYHVGSAREDVGKSGFAHLFEHMMFQGSQNVGDEEHFRLISEAGGTLNGTTNTDRTNYFETAPSNQLELLLWLEADRMGFLLPAVTQQKFEIQRATVKNERGQNYDNRPYGLLYERVGEAMYPEGHPYSWSTIGYMEDLDRVDVNDLKAFFLRWYGPNNATLTIGGDFDTQQALDWIVKYFGSIPEGPAVDSPDKPSVSLDADRYISMEDDVSLPLLYMAYPTVYARHPDEAPLDVLMAIMGQGQTSLLYKNLVRDGLAVQANVGHGCGELSCTFSVNAMPNPATGATMADLERIIRETFEEFEAEGASEDDIERMRMRIVSSMIYGLESVSGKVSQLAFYETFTGDPNYIAADIERYESVTAEDVMRVYETYIKDKPAVVMSIVPEGQADAVAAPDTWSRYERTLPDYEQIDESELALREPEDSFDRAARPVPGPAVTVSLPELWHAELANGVEVIGAVSEETPTTTMLITGEVGAADQSLDMLGVAGLTAAMLNEATEESTVEELSDRLQKLGSSVGFSVNDNNNTLQIRSLTENLDETLDIAAEKFFTPLMAEEDFVRRKDQAIQSLRQQEKTPSATADTARRIALYGRDNAFAYPGLGLEETVADLTLDDVTAFYADRVAPSLAHIIVVSDLSQEEVLAKLDAFGAAPREEVERQDPAPYPALDAGTLYLIDNPGGAQSEIRIAKRALTYDATGEYYRAGLMNYPLGGGFNSRINLNLREDKGYTYGARGGFTGTDYAGAYVASAGVRSDATAASIVEFMTEIQNFADNGMTQEELDFTRAAISQNEALTYETPGQKAGLMSQIMTYDLPDDFKTEQGEILNTISREELNALAAEHLQTEDFVLIVVGDTATVMPQLADLDYPVVQTDGLLNPAGESD